VPELNPGTYYLHVQHRGQRNQNDFNYYDIRLSLTPLAQDCQVGETDAEACGMCGQRTRRCGDNGLWMAWGECGNEGVCQPDATRSEPCELCGTRPSTCTAACQWEAGECGEQGVCEQAAKESRDCMQGEGVEERICNEQCTWGDWGSCGAATCQEGETRECYSGPAGTAGTGVCKVGQEQCEAGGAFGPCQGAITPTSERCSGGQDEDCDGDSDAADTDCQDLPALGDPCTADGDCANGQTCLRDPEHAVFFAGYCGVVDCLGQCPVGASCVDAFGESYCLKNCNGAQDCRQGYACALVQGGRHVCLPKCTQDADCTDPAKPLCAVGTGLCTVDGTAGDAGGSGSPEQDAGGGGGDPVDPGGSGGGGVSGGSGKDGGATGCACRITTGGSADALWLLVGFAWLVWRRREGPPSA